MQTWSSSSFPEKPLPFSSRAVIRLARMSPVGTGRPSAMAVSRRLSGPSRMPRMVRAARQARKVEGRSRVGMRASFIMPWA